MIVLGVGLLALAQSAWCVPRTGPTRTVQAFFEALRGRKYDKAYSFLSAALKEEIPFETFKSRASDILAIRLLGLKTVDSEKNLVKYRVAARVRMRYEGSLYEAVYGGQVDMVSEKAGWKVYSVDLKARGGKTLPQAQDERAIRFRREH